ncbi:MAG TPA: Xaa-Pro peptidase family protein [Candidatus Dormibacteraeota bacterium]|nr:Xaa-Pro peptidase family protein [Candidatus Dormibacteraeota bacterium]
MYGLKLDIPYQPKVPYDWKSREPWVQLPFPQSEYDDRIRRVREAMRAFGLDALVIYGAPGGEEASARWLTNFSTFGGPQAVVVPPDGEPWLFCSRNLHGEPMHSLYWQTWVREAHPAAAGDGPAARAAEMLASTDAKRVGVAGWETIPRTWADALARGLPGRELVSATSMLIELRSVKSPLEIDKMRQASMVAGQALKAAMDACRPGATEHQVSGIAHQVLFGLGAEAVAFDTAVAAGPRTGLKHSVPTGRVMQEGDMVFIDIGARMDGYNSDLSRTFVIGEPSAEQRRFLATAERMFKVWLDEARPGSVVPELKKKCQEIAYAEGYVEEHMPMGQGHGLGTAVWEMPWFSFEANQVLKPGMVFALEPMLVRLGFGTAVVEDTMLVTDSGVEALSGLPTAFYS